MTNGSSTDSCFIDIQTATNTRRAIVGIDGIGLANIVPGALYVGTQSNHPILFATQGVERMRVSAVGILETPQVIRKLPSAAVYTLTALSPLPNNLISKVENWTLRTTIGDNLTAATNGDFTNNLGRTVAVTVSFRTQKNSNGFGVFQSWLQYDGIRWGFQVRGALDAITATVTLIMPNGAFFFINAYQDSGVGGDVAIDSQLTYVIH